MAQVNPLDEFLRQLEGVKPAPRQEPVPATQSTEIIPPSSFVAPLPRPRPATQVVAPPAQVVGSPGPLEEVVRALRNAGGLEQTPIGAMGGTPAVPVPPESEALPRASGIAPRVESQNIFTSFGSGLARGFNRAQQAVPLVKLTTGVMDEGAAAAVAEQFRQEMEYAYDPEIQEATAALQDPKNAGFFGAIKVAATHPKFAASIMGESFGQSTIAAASGAVGALGGLVGAIPALAAGSAVTEYGSAMAQFMQDEYDVDLSDEEQIAGFFADPEALAKARNYAIKRGLSVGAVDGLTAFIAPKVVTGFATKLGRKVPGVAGREVTPTSRAVGIGAGAATEATGEGAGEALAQAVSTGAVNMQDVALEMTAGVIGGAPELAVSMFADRKNRGEGPLTAPTEEELRRVLGGAPPPPVLSPEEAATQGRTLYGFDTGKGETRVYSDYSQAEREAGIYGVRNGRLIAVAPEEVTAPRTSVDVIEAAGLPTLQRGMIRLEDVGATTKLQELLRDIQKTPSLDLVAEAETILATNTIKLLPPALRQAAGVFVGDSRGRQIDYKRVNYADLVADNFNTQGGTFTPGGRSNVRRWKKDIDLDRLQPGMLQPLTASLEALAKGWGRDTVKRLALEGGSAPEVVDSLMSWLAHDPSMSAQDIYKLMGQGQLKFKPEARLYTAGGFVDTDEAGKTRPEARAGVQTATVDRPNTSATGLLVPYAQGTHLTEVTGGVRRADGAVGGVILDPLGIQLKDIVDPDVRRAIAAGSGLMDKIIKDHKMPYDIKLSLYSNPLDSNQGYIRSRLGEVEIAINMAKAGDAASVWRIISHEFGHFLVMAGFVDMKPEHRTRILGAYRRFLLTTEAFAGDPMSRAGQFLRNMTGSDPNYSWSFDEWFAEQVARWGSTNRKPLGFVARATRPLGRLLLRVLRQFKMADPTNLMRAEPEVEAFLDTILNQKVRGDWAQQIIKWHEATTQIKNEQAQDYDIGPMSPMTPASATLRDVVAKLGEDKIIAEAKLLGIQIPGLPSVMAQVDRFNWFYKWALSLPQLAEINQHIPELQAYRELVQLAQVEQGNIMTGAHDRLKEWRNLGPAQSKALGELLFELTQMDRNPTQPEMLQMIQRYQLSGRSVQVLAGVQQDFREALDRYIGLLVEAANAIPDSAARQSRLNEIVKMHRNLLSKPYFPMTRYGRWTLTIRNQGSLEHFETFETKREMEVAYRKARELYPQGSGYSVQTATLREDVVPYLGVPPQMLDLIDARLALNPTQKAALAQLRFELSPAQSFKKRFMRRKGTAGWSDDAQRNYAHYFFHHAKHFMRVKYQPLLKGQIDQLFASKNLRGDSVVKLTEIGNFMAHHMGEMLNPKKDLAALRSVAAVWYLGFVPQSALLNLTQLGFATAPFLANKFGDLRTIGAMRRAALSTSTFYSKPRLASMSDPEIRALSEAIEEGIIDESQAAELAALSEGNSILASVPAKGVREKWMGFTNLAMVMFKHAEQFNRRVTFRAAWRLAMDNPGTPWLAQLRTKHALQYQRLLSRGWSQTEAMAFLAGKDATLSTQFEYARYARPRFMQGRKGALFMFFLFTQNMSFMLLNNKGIIPRYMLAMALIGGLMGLPGAEDAADIIKAMAGRFGKDFDVEREARKALVEVLSPEGADLVLRGVARDSMGIPQLMDMAGVTEFPQIDMSRQISMGKVLPINPAFLIGSPGMSAEKAISEGVQNMAGAAFGIGFNVAQTLLDQSTPWNDPKRWERAIPRAAKNAVRVARIMKNGGETDRGGAMLAEFDYQDPVQMAELLALGAGFQPTRLSRAWDRRIAEIEVNKFWDYRRGLVFDQYARAFMKKDPEMVESAKAALRRYNEEVPYASKKITAESVRQSVRNREGLRQRRENLMPARRSGFGVTEEVNRLYPAEQPRRLRDLERGNVTSTP